MKKNYLLPVFLLAILNLEAQTGTPLYIGSCDNDLLNDMRAHGKYIYGTGRTHSFGASAGDIYLFKADTSGNRLWARLISTGDDIDEGVAFDITSTNQIVVTCRVPHDLGSSMILYFDTTGILLQSYVMNNTGHSCLGITGKPDGSALFCGWQVTPGRYLPVIINTDVTGNILWSKTLAGNPGSDSTAGNGLGTAAIVLPDGDIMVTGSTGVGPDVLPFVARLDASGNLIWQHTYNMPCLNGYGNIIPTSDGNYMVCGSAIRSPGPGSDPFVLKIDDTGMLLFSYVYRIHSSTVPRTSLPYVRILEHEENFLLTGTYARNMTGDSSDFYALHLDATGNIHWANRYGNSSQNICRQVVGRSHGFIIGGHSIENADGNAIVGHAQSDIVLLPTSGDGTAAVNTNNITITQNIFVIDTVYNTLTASDYAYSPTPIAVLVTNVESTYDSASCFGLDVAELALHEGMVLYPNPAIAYTEVVMQNPVPLFDLFIHNTNGELVLSLANIQNGKTLVNVNTFVPGIYLVTARSDNRIIGSQKLVVH